MYNVFMFLLTEQFWKDVHHLDLVGMVAENKKVAVDWLWK